MFSVDKEEEQGHVDDMDKAAKLRVWETMMLFAVGEVTSA